MPLRTILHEGTEWTVWNVVPSLDSRLRIQLSEPTDGGWLCFQSAQEKRRIVPAPAGWEEWSDEELADRLSTAAVVRPSAAAGARADLEREGRAPGGGEGSHEALAPADHAPVLTQDEERSAEGTVGE